MGQGRGMGRVELARRVAGITGTGQDAADTAVKAVLRAIAETLNTGEGITLEGFGAWRIKDIPARETRNPATGETALRPAKRRVTWKQGKGLVE